MRIIRAKFEWKFEDFWMGAFWKHGHIQTNEGPVRYWTDIWICFIPCVPLHLTLTYNLKIKS